MLIFELSFLQLVLDQLLLQWSWVVYNMYYLIFYRFKKLIFIFLLLMMMCEINRLNVLDQGEPVMDFPTIKSNFSLGLKYSDWMNSRTYLRLMKLGPFYREFGVDLLVKFH